MTAALSLPITPTPPPSNAAASQTTASNDSAPDQPPFASVLQQKVQNNNAPKDSQSNAPSKEQVQAAGKTETPAKSGTDASASAPAQQTETSNAADAKDVALAQGEATQTTLQNLLPWMLSMQQAGQKTTATSTSDDTDSKSSTTPADALSALLNGTAQPVLPGLTTAATTAPAQPTTEASDAASDKSGPGLMLDLGGKGKADSGKETASTTANLAAATDASLKADNEPALPQGATQQGTFDAALQNAREQTTAAHVNATSNTQTADAARTIQAPLGSARWQNEIGEQVRWMSNQHESKAELVLTPPQLGRIEISLNVSGDQANAMFVSANPQVREALEGAMDRLREVLASSGITLGQANVGAESTHQGGADQQFASRGGSGASGIDNNLDSSRPVAQNWMRQSNNMLDVFA